MNAITKSDTIPLAVIIPKLVARYGMVRVILALGKALVWPRSRGKLTQSDISPHLRRDIGLPPEPSLRKYWELR